MIKIKNEFTKASSLKQTAKYLFPAKYRDKNFILKLFIGTMP